MRSLLIVTTFEDKSLPLFYSKKITDNYNLSVLLFNEKIDNFADFLDKHQQFDDIYIRDPFNSGQVDNLDKKLQLLFKPTVSAHYIDNLKSASDVYFEDKWRQYQIFRDLMPKTEIMELGKKYDMGNYFIKKRISSRGKGVVLNLENFAARPDDYIVQRKLEIKKEYRVNVVNKQIIKMIVGKQLVIDDKVSNKVRVVIQPPEQIPNRLHGFVEEITGFTNFDFVGYDIAELADGHYVLIEANRSPQFLVFFHKLGINLAEKLFLKC